MEDRNRQFLAFIDPVTEFSVSIVGDRLVQIESEVIVHESGECRVFKLHRGHPQRSIERQSVLDERGADTSPQQEVAGVCLGRQCLEISILRGEPDVGSGQVPFVGGESSKLEIGP